jgi:hypothetical protein
VNTLESTSFNGFCELLINYVGEFAMTYWIVSKFLSPKRHNRGKTQRTIKSFILQRSHIMILNSTKFGGNRTKDVEVKLCTLQDVHIFPELWIMTLKVVFQICFGSIKMMGTWGVLVPRSAQLSYSIYVSMRDSSSVL